MAPAGPPRPPWNSTAGTVRGWQDPEAVMGLMVTIFIAVCAAIGWLRSRGRGGGSRRRLLRAMGLGLAVAWIALWLFGLGLLAIGLVLLCGGALVLPTAGRAAFRLRGHGPARPPQSGA